MEEEDRREEMVLRSKSSLAEGEKSEAIVVKFLLHRSVVSLNLGRKVVGTLNSEADRDNEKLMFSATSCRLPELVKSSRNTWMW